MFLNGRKISQELVWMVQAAKAKNFKKAGMLFGKVLVEATSESKDDLFLF